MAEDRTHYNRRRRGFEQVSGLVLDPVREASARRGFAMSRVLTHWAEVAGPGIAAVCQPVKVGRSGHGLGATLTVLTNGANAPIVEMQKDALRERLNACYGYNAIARVRVTQIAGHGFAETQADFAGTPDGGGSGASRPAGADPQTIARAGAAVEAVRDAGLRAALEALALTILARRQTPAAASPQAKGR